MVEVFVLVFGVVFVVGFVARALMTTSCPHCHSRIDRGVEVCATCGRTVSPSP